MNFMCRENCDEKMEQFLKRCFYHSGLYDSEENFAELDRKLKEHEVHHTRFSNCFFEVFYFSLQLHFISLWLCSL